MFAVFTGRSHQGGVVKHFGIVVRHDFVSVSQREGAMRTGPADFFLVSKVDAGNFLMRKSFTEIFLPNSGGGCAVAENVDRKQLFIFFSQKRI